MGALNFESHWNHINHGQRHFVHGQAGIKALLCTRLPQCIPVHDIERIEFTYNKIIGGIIMSTKKKLILGWLAVIIGASVSVYSLIGMVSSIINQ